MASNAAEESSAAVTATNIVAKPNPNVWLVRAGRKGEREELAIEQGVATIGWAELGDLSSIKTREALHDRMLQVHPEESKFVINNWVSQVWAFIGSMREGDIVAMPLKKTNGIALGRVTGPYRYLPGYVEFDAAHARPVQWIRKSVPRSDFGQDLLYSLGAFMTVCKIERNNAGARIRAILSGAVDAAAADSAMNGSAEPGVALAQTDIEAEARATIMDAIIRRYKGHDLERLVEAILVAQGFVVKRTEKGADGGVDLTAGRGEFGFDPPRMCVQVKSNEGQIDPTPIRELQGTLKDFGADHALFVAWGGFTPTAAKEARRKFFQVRLWSADDLLDELLKVYDQLPEDMRNSIPLKRIWTLVPESSLTKG